MTLENTYMYIHVNVVLVLTCSSLARLWNSGIRSCLTSSGSTLFENSCREGRGASQGEGGGETHS